MGLIDRRRGPAGRWPDRDIQGLLHDLGHEITALSYLVEAVREDVSLSGEAGSRLELLTVQTSRVLRMIEQGMASPGEAAGGGLASVRRLAGQFAQVASLAYQREVTLRPGPDAPACVSSVVLWRLLSNVVGNAVQAAGPHGRVDLAIHPSDEAIVIAVTDDGPGFGAGPPGPASAGLGVVRSLLNSCGGALSIGAPPGGGTTVCLRLPRPGGSGQPVAVLGARSR